MKKITLVGIVTILCLSAKAQNMGSDYKTALGVKFYPGAISLKSFIKPNKALEGLAYIYSDGVRFTGLYEIHGDITGAEGLKWYVGPGAHIGFWSDNWKHDHPHENSGMIFGVDGVIGLDYKFNGAPINVSLDWQPFIHVCGIQLFRGWFWRPRNRYTF
jgi:hypothetical protein